MTERQGNQELHSSHPDGYTEAQLEEICQQLWANSCTLTERHFRTLVDLLLGHYMLTRGGDRRAVKISDLFSLELKGEGPTRCMPLIVGWQVWQQTGGAMRNRQPMVCLLSALGFYLLWRWDLTQEAFPDLGHWSTWHNIRPLKVARNGAASTDALAREVEKEWLDRAFRYARVASLMTTQIGHSPHGKTVELKDPGFLSQEQNVGYYSNVLPRIFMRKRAGHSPQAGCFEIGRAHAVPSPCLLSKIWPVLNHWIRRSNAKTDTGERDDPTTVGFIDLLVYLREVILQDSVILRAKFPTHPVWGHPVFEDEEYESFAARVRAKEPLCQLATPAEMFPMIINCVRSIEAKVDARLGEMSAMLKENNTRLTSIERQLVQSRAPASTAQIAPYNYTPGHAPHAGPHGFNPASGVHPGSVTAPVPCGP